jgi:hypothetical protein
MIRGPLQLLYAQTPRTLKKKKIEVHTDDFNPAFCVGEHFCVHFIIDLCVAVVPLKCIVMLRQRTILLPDFSLYLLQSLHQFP